MGEEACCKGENKADCKAASQLNSLTARSTVELGRGPHITKAQIFASYQIAVSKSPVVRQLCWGC